MANTHLASYWRLNCLIVKTNLARSAFTTKLFRRLLYMVARSVLTTKLFRLRRLLGRVARVSTGRRFVFIFARFAREGVSDGIEVGLNSD